MKQTKLLWISNVINNFFKSRWAIIFLFVFYGILGGLQYLLYATGNLQVNTNGLGGWYPWFMIGLTTIAGSLTLFSAILTARLNKVFFYFSAVSLLMWLINSYFIDYYLDMIKISILFIPTIIRYARWRVGEKSGQENMKTPKLLGCKKYIPSLFIMLGISIGVGASMSALNIYGNDVWPPKPYLDSINLFAGLYGAMLISFGYIEGWGTFLITSAVLMAIFINAEQWSTLSTVILFFFVNNGTGLAWYAHYKESKTTI